MKLRPCQVLVEWQKGTDHAFPHIISCHPVSDPGPFDQLGKDQVSEGAITLSSSSHGRQCVSYCTGTRIVTKHFVSMGPVFAAGCRERPVVEVCTRRTTPFNAFSLPSIVDVRQVKESVGRCQDSRRSRDITGGFIWRLPPTCQRFRRFTYGVKRILPYFWFWSP